MSFSEYLPRMNPKQFPEEAFLAEIGRALRGHLRRQGLWEHPPEYLGYPDFQTWPDVFAAGDATADPTLDCYLEAVVRRYDSLMVHLNAKRDITGLVHLNIKRFILKRQKAHDPIGYAVFKNLEATLQELIGAGQLRLVQADPHGKGKLRNETVLAFAPAPLTLPSPPGGEGRVRGATREQIEAAVDGPEWHKTLPRLTKLGIGAQRLLRECLVRLSGAQIQTFRLGDLVGVLKLRVRAAHAQRNRLPDQEVVAEGKGDGTVGALIRMVRPESGYQERRENLERLLQCLHDHIARLDLQERTRDGLRRLVRELEQQAVSDEDIPSWAELARQLGTQRTTLWDHLERIRKLAQNCQEEM